MMLRHAESAPAEEVGDTLKPDPFTCADPFLPKPRNAGSLTPSDSEVSTRTPLRRAACSQSQAAPRFTPEIPLSVAAVPHPKSPASAEPATLSKSTDLRLTRTAPTMPLPDPIPLKIQFPSNCRWQRVRDLCPRHRVQHQATHRNGFESALRGTVCVSCARTVLWGAGRAYPGIRYPYPKH